MLPWNLPSPALKTSGLDFGTVVSGHSRNDLRACTSLARRRANRAKAQLHKLGLGLDICRSEGHPLLRPDKARIRSVGNAIPYQQFALLQEHYNVHRSGFEFFPVRSGPR